MRTQRGLRRGLVEERYDVLCAVLELSVLSMEDQLKKLTSPKNRLNILVVFRRGTGIAIEDVCSMVELGRSLGS